MAPSPLPAEKGRRKRSATRRFPDGVRGIPYPPQPPAPTSYPCPECGETFSRDTRLKFHRRNHVNPRCRHKFRFQCLMCSQKFQDAPQLGRHYALRHKSRADSRHANGRNRRMRFKCPKCDKDYSASNSMKAHIIKKHLNRFQ